MPGSQATTPDPRNAAIRIWLNGTLVAREAAMVSVFDAGFIAGDGVWEGFRLHRGRLLFADEHLDRLARGAASIGLDIGLGRAELLRAVAETVAANGMTDGVHIRLMVTRGPKSTPSQDPAQSLGRPTVVIVAEHKIPNPGLATEGLSLATAGVRCTRPDQFDMRLNSHSRLPLILALLEARAKGADEALMLDDSGCISTCNATNFFFVRAGRVCTSTGLACFGGITRAKVIALCERHAIPLACADFPPAALADAEEAFVTGTFGGITPVRSIDARALPVPGPLTRRLASLYGALIDGLDPARTTEMPRQA